MAFTLRWLATGSAADFAQPVGSLLPRAAVSFLEETRGSFLSWHVPRIENPAPILNSVSLVEKCRLHIKSCAPTPFIVAHCCLFFV
jgi:hypothetical protein